MRKSLFKQTPINGRLLAGILGAILMHGGLWYSNFFVTSHPQYEVVVSPSVLEVALVKPAPKKEKAPERPPENVEVPLPVEKPEEVIEPEVIQPEPQLEEPEESEEPVEEPQKPEEEPKPVEEIQEDLEPIKDVEIPEDEQQDEQPEEINIKRGVLTEAVPLTYHNQPPRYPRKARQRGWEGRVTLRVDVQENGRVGRLSIIQSSGYGILDDAAVKAVRRWQFEPAFRFGRTVRSEIEIPVVFRLR